VILREYATAYAGIKLYKERIGFFNMIKRRQTAGQNYYVSRFLADINNLRRAVNETLEFFEKTFFCLDDSTRYELKVVLSELLINAIKHGGGKNGTGGHVKLVAGMTTEDCAFLIVEDDGDGYDTERVGRYRGGAYGASAYGAGAGGGMGGGVGVNILDGVEETGRGIYIVKNLCDDFMVNEKGNKVVINKTLRRAAV
jgi:serine/threonine-protein kinase RsbW